MANENLHGLKETYHKPKLSIYGNISAITANVANTSMNNDAGGGGKTKTA
uniref:Uncharacterized protein n=1 Tax=Cyanothece sp. (strain PCC 7425 / ATCC 29141) TaxID=395961 RepID=B8HXW8_CYAP4